jgi:hypothetical protein
LEETMLPRLKVYHTHDGTRRYMVTARNLREAAGLLNTTVGDIRRHGGVYTDQETVAVALGEPGRVWKRALHYGSAPEPWAPE